MGKMVMSRRSLRSFALAAIAGLCLALTVAACGSSGGQSTGEASTDEASTGEAQAAGGAGSKEASPELSGSVDLGAIFPLTGGLAALGEAQVNGAELAAEQVNEEGGVLGKKLEMQIEDSAGETVPSVEAAQKLVSVNHVPVVLGELTSGNTIAIGKYLQRSHVVQINTGSSSPEIRGIGNYSFSVIGLDTLSSKFAAEKVYEGGYRKVGFLAPNNSYGINIANAFKKYFEEEGGEVVTSVLFPEAKSDYRSELGRLQSSDAELYVYPPYAPESETINKNAYELGIKSTKWFGIYLSLQIEGLEPQIIEGQQGIDFSYVGKTAGAQFKKAYEARYNEALTAPYAALAYDGVKLAAEAINEAESAEPSAIREALTKVGQNFPGASGSITFDKDNQRVEQEYDILSVNEKGELIPEPKVKLYKE